MIDVSYWHFSDVAETSCLRRLVDVKQTSCWGGAQGGKRPNCDFPMPTSVCGTSHYSAVDSGKPCARQIYGFTVQDGANANARAFSPADTFPRTPRAKLLMMAESAISLITIAVVAQRAVGILN